MSQPLVHCCRAAYLERVFHEEYKLLNKKLHCKEVVLLVLSYVPDINVECNKLINIKEINTYEIINVYCCHWCTDRTIPDYWTFERLNRTQLADWFFQQAEKTDLRRSHTYIFVAKLILDINNRWIALGEMYIDVDGIKIYVKPFQIEVQEMSVDSELIITRVYTQSIYYTHNIYDSEDDSDE